TPTAVPFDRTRISVRTGVGTACEAPIRNRDFDPVDKRSHSEISGRGYGCSNIADIVTPSSLFPPLQPKNWT
ncbi:hypothetical protein Taro_014733, partial [Colocasia esculenta]|nr:hypothetical protein [Colocasia esculenta]